MLEHHSDVFTHFVDVGVRVGYGMAVHHHMAGCDLLQTVQAPQKRTLTGTGGAYHAYHFPFSYLNADVLKDFQLSEILFQVMD